MRHQFTPLFRDFLTSSMWAADPATRCVWIWFLLMADPEGYVVGTAPGVAQQAGVTIEQARAAIALLESPDPDSSSPELEGRRIIKVERGWHIVNFVAHRERAKQESEKARKRAWAQQQRDATRQLTLPGVEVDASSETIDAPKPKPTPKPSPSEIRSPAPEQSLPARVFTLDGWEPSAELRERARIAGVEDFDERIAQLRTGPIGGNRGVLPHKVDDYVASQFPKWRVWKETDRAKARSSAASGPRSSFGGVDGGQEPPKAKRLPGLPVWVVEAHAKFAKANGLNLKAEAKAFAGSHHLPLESLRPVDVFRPFMEYLERRASKEVA